MPRFTRAELESFRGAEVPDLLGPDVRLLFVGINPGLWTAATQTHFAHPGNRFYPALLLAGILEHPIDQAAGMTDADRDRLRARGIGITNLVRRATAPRRRADAATSCATAAARLEALVRRTAPRVVARRRHHGVPHGVRPPQGHPRPPARGPRRRRAVGGAQPERPQRARDRRHAGRGVRRPRPRGRPSPSD